MINKSRNDKTLARVSFIDLAKWGCKYGVRKKARYPPITNEPSPKTSSKNPFIAARIQITKIITNKIMSIIEKSI